MLNTKQDLLKLPLLALLIILLLSACSSKTGPIPFADLPDPAAYNLTSADMPQVDEPWVLIAEQSDEDAAAGWVDHYLTYRTERQPSAENGMEYFVHLVSSNVRLYTQSLQPVLTDPPNAIDSYPVTWQAVETAPTFGDSSAVWRTTYLDQGVEVIAYFVEFIHGHASVGVRVLSGSGELSEETIYDLIETLVDRVPAL